MTCYGLYEKYEYLRRELSEIHQCIKFYFMIECDITNNKKYLESTEEELDIIYDKKLKEVEDVEKLMRSIEI